MNESMFENEPDELTGEFAGYAVYIRRHPTFQHLCGYVGVTRTHPWFGRNYNDKVIVPSKVLERPIDVDKVGIVNFFCAAAQNEPVAALDKEKIAIALAIDVHGGLTFADKFIDRELWWFGFDCAHLDDWSKYNETGTYRDINYVKAECESLAQQLRDIENEL